MGRKKPGPKPQRRNPYPLADELVVEYGGRMESVWLPLSETTAWIAADQVDKAERALRQSFKARGRELDRRPGETVETATWRIMGLVREVAEENAAEPLWWTGRRQEEVKEYPAERLYPLTREPDGSWMCRYVGPDPEEGSKGPKHGSTWRYRLASRPRERYDEASRSWRPMDTPAHVIEKYDEASQSWKLWIAVPDADEKWIASMARPTPWVPKSTWLGLTTALRDPIGRMLRGEMGRAGKDGRLAYLAYSTLGYLLATTPERIRTLLDSYRNPRRRGSKT